MTYAVARRTAIRAVLAAVALAASAACSPSSADRDSVGAGNSVPTEPPRTTTTNPYAVPAVIDVAYVNRVLAGLDAAVGDVLRLVQRTNTIPREAYDHLKALYADPEFMQIKIDGYQRDIREGFKGYKPAPGNRQSAVTRLISATPNCIFAQINRDYASVGVNPLSELQTQWVGLTPLDRARDPHGYNPTQWAFTYDGLTADRSQPSNPCGS
ncbi:MAG: hypothetical protein LC808_15095 [Actinobacteria bacterium]|nr:hypothetical protein [Actinomycetota bacterium]